VPRILGIDLGTTNTAVAFADDADEPAVVPIPQLVSGGRDALELLPSALYAPVSGEDLADPWDAPPFIVGALARDRGAEVPGRSVTSAKSWLGHPTEDAEGPILPWGAAEGAPRISPVDASAMLLSHVRAAYDAAYPDTPASKCDVVLTIPASFHDGARFFTLEAAKRAGLNVTLIEEPQAAFYDCLRYTRKRVARRKSVLDKFLKQHDGEAKVLVVDVGGGTTDLSLLRLGTKKNGTPDIERVATGEHLLLGGDNMDLAIAQLVEEKLGTKLGPSQRGELVRRCRAAKEVLLAADGPSKTQVVVAARGSQLVGNVLRATLTRKEVLGIVVDGFFPEVSVTDEPAAQQKSGLVARGLPYARDPAITKHIARFVQRFAGGALPDAVLLNGGVFRAEPVRQALLATLSAWRGEEVDELPHEDPDLAVARGAVLFGQARRGEGLRIRAGAPRSYYVGVGNQDDGTPRGVCVIPRGTAEGETRSPEHVFKLRTGEEARFELWRAETAVKDPVGTVVALVPESFARLPPLVFRVPGSEGFVDVRLIAGLSVVGTVDLRIEERAATARSFALTFQVRKGEAGSLPPPSVEISRKLEAAKALLKAAFTSKEPRAVKDLLRDLEKLQGSRETWSAALARGMFDELLSHRGARRWTQDHERVFWMLSGFLLRPGFGMPHDNTRIEALFPLLAQKLSFPDRTHNWQAFFIAWRRVAPGLTSAMQQQLFDAYAPFVMPGKAPKGKTPPPSPEEMRELLSFLERVDLGRRQMLGAALIEETYGQVSPNLFADIGRLGARMPLYGEAALMLPASIVEPWVEQWLRLPWDKRPGALPAALRMSRMTGDARRDLSERVRQAVVARGKSLGATEDMLKPLGQVVHWRREERVKHLGDTLPVGLTLGDE